jgi:hypothetical protein
LILDVEVKTGKERNDGNNAAKQKTVKENDKTIALIIPQIILIIINNRFFVNSFLLVAFMGSLFIPMQKPVWDIHKIYSICYES